jgi:NAD(P)H-hydrate epimerase
MDILRLSKALDMNSTYLGVDRLILMENAGREAAKYAADSSSVAVFAGLGNNGGDGLVAARHLSAAGKNVTVVTLQGPRSRECQKNFDVVEKLDSIKVVLIRDSADVGALDLSGYGAVIDALLGVGARGEVREPIRSLVDAMNKSKGKKIAVDCPTPGFKADVTVSFHFKKCDGAEVAGIGIPREAEGFCGPGDVYLAVPKRTGGEHKGDFGRVLVVGGSRDYFGAPALVGFAALRTGADLATVCCPSYVAERLSDYPDLIVRPLESEYALKESDVDRILKVDFDALVVGNGLGTDDGTRDAVKKLLKEAGGPTIVDADTLKLIKPRHIRSNMVLTPHAKEFELLFDEAPSDRAAAAEKYAKEHGCVILLKGPVDVVSDGKRTKKNRTGNPGMTVGGTGDVLAGIAGALSCKADLFTSACAAAFLSGAAGDFAFKEKGFSLTASDCIGKIPDALKFCGCFE